jgi:hypothetical protein
MGRALKDLWRNAADFVVVGLHNRYCRPGAERCTRKRNEQIQSYVAAKER